MATKVENKERLHRSLHRGKPKFLGGSEWDTFELVRSDQRNPENCFFFFLYLGFLELFEVHDNLHWYTDVYHSLLSHYVQWCSIEKRQRMFFTKLKRHLRRGNNRPKGTTMIKTGNDYHRGGSESHIHWGRYYLFTVHFMCFFFREICGQRVAFLASSCIFMPVWRVKCLMSLSGQLARYGYIHVLVWRFTR